MTFLKRRSFLQLAAAALPSSLFAKSLQPQPSVPPVTAPIPSGGDRYDFKRVLPNGTTTFKVSSKDCRGDFFAMEHHHTSKGGPPRHLHHIEDEWFYVLEGEYLVEVGTELHHLKAGDSVLGPRGVSHAFAFVGEGAGRFLITYAPAGKMEEFFNTRDRAGGRTTYVNDAEKMRAYNMELLGPPLSIT
jgi:mannose-6-phosphate isomerase-like protein (cupin superfamily)